MEEVTKGEQGKGSAVVQRDQHLSVNEIDLGKQAEVLVQSYPLYALVVEVGVDESWGFPEVTWHFGDGVEGVRGFVPSLDVEAILLAYEVELESCS